MSPRTLFIDFEAFQHGSENFLMKELCLLDSNSPLRPLYFLFKPSKVWNELSKEQQRTYAYQEHRIHHLSWSEGYTQYCSHCVEYEIKKAFPLITGIKSICYVLGRQKADFLRRELPMLNIQEYEYAKTYKDLPQVPAHLTCTYRHHSREHCAVLKTYQLYAHYESL
jgi:hypothetical protein